MFSPKTSFKDHHVLVLLNNKVLDVSQQKKKQQKKCDYITEKSPEAPTTLPSLRNRDSTLNTPTPFLWLCCIICICIWNMIVYIVIVYNTLMLVMCLILNKIFFLSESFTSLSFWKEHGKSASVHFFDKSAQGFNTKRIKKKKKDTFYKV